MSRRHTKRHKELVLIHDAFLTLMAIILLLFSGLLDFDARLTVFDDDRFLARVTALDRPNIVLINLDDMFPSQYLYLQDITDAFIAHSMGIINFENSYVTTPLCCPSRASLLTGNYVSRHGVHFNNEKPLGAGNGGAAGFQANGWEANNLALWLDNNGYNTGLVGKYLNGYSRMDPLGYVPPGWDFWVAFASPQGDENGHYYDYTLSFNGVLREYGNNPSEYSTDVLRNQGARFIRRVAKEEAPFFLYWAPFTPHGINIPADRHEGIYPNVQVPRTPSYNEVDMRDKPEWTEALTWNEGDEISADRHYRLGAEALASVSEAIIAMIEELEAGGRLDNTLIVFTNDNGFSGGEHKYFGKRCAWEECVRVPLVMASRAFPLGARTIENIVTNIDIAPTIAEFADITPILIDGLSLVPLIENTSGPVWDRTSITIEHFMEGDFPLPPSRPIPSWTGIVEIHEDGTKWKRVEYFTGDKELYNLTVDPYELDNLLHSDKRSEGLEMRHLLDRLNDL